MKDKVQKPFEIKESKEYPKSKINEIFKQFNKDADLFYSKEDMIEFGVHVMNQYFIGFGDDDKDDVTKLLNLWLKSKENGNK